MEGDTFQDAEGAAPLLREPAPAAESSPSPSPPTELALVIPVPDPPVPYTQPAAERDVTATPPTSSPPPPPPPPDPVPPKTSPPDKGSSSTSPGDKMVVPFRSRPKASTPAQEKAEPAPRFLRLEKIDGQPADDLAKLTRAMPRDLRGRTRQYIVEQATKAWPRMADESMIVTIAYQDEITKITARSLAQAPLAFVKDLSSKAATLVVGNSWDVCFGHRQCTGLIYRADIESIRWVLLATLRSHFGVDAEPVVEEAFYSYFVWPGMCYINVTIVNVSALFSRSTKEIVDTKRAPTATAVNVMTGGGRSITIDPENLL